MKRRLDIVKGLIWLAFFIATFALFMPDLKHTLVIQGDNGSLVELTDNPDYALKFLVYVFVFLPVLIFTFVRLNLFNKIVSIVLPLFAMIAYVKVSAAFNEDGYFMFGGPKYDGYVPYLGFYFSVFALIVALIAASLKWTVREDKVKMEVKDVIDDF